ncbi:MAG: hypothetical protein WBG02_14830 [Candidatus Acidiferrum sp.]
MGAHLPRIPCLSLAAILLFPLAAAPSQKKHKPPKKEEPKIENYYGGVFLVGEGGIPNGPCFRINGRVTSGGFFDLLKSYHTDDGTTFRVGTDAVTQFPDKVMLSLTVHDQPCGYGLQPVGTGVYLTKEAMNSLRLSLYWKHGVDMRPAGKVNMLHFSIEPMNDYTDTLATDLPERYLWSYELGIPSAGVPLTDSLVLIFRNSAGHMVARVAARL